MRKSLQKRGVGAGQNQGLSYWKAEARGGPVAIDEVRFTDRSCIDGLVGVELYCHGMFISIVLSSHALLRLWFLRNLSLNQSG